MASRKQRQRQQARRRHNQQTTRPTMHGPAGPDSAPVPGRAPEPKATRRARVEAGLYDDVETPAPRGSQVNTPINRGRQTANMNRDYYGELGREHPLTRTRRGRAAAANQGRPPNMKQVLAGRTAKKESRNILRSIKRHKGRTAMAVGAAYMAGAVINSKGRGVDKVPKGTRPTGMYRY